MPKVTLYSKDEEIILNTQIQKRTDNNDELMKNIKEIFTEKKENTKKNTIYFVSSRGKFSFNIDDTIFLPNKLTLLKIRNFEDAYLEQLENYIYTSKEEIDPNSLLSIIYLFSHINKSNYPIRIVTAKYNKLLSKICNVLNIFFNKNYNVIFSIYTMFNSIKDTEEELKTSST